METGSLPQQALRCTLAGVRPIASTWIQGATSRFSEVVSAHPLSMRTAAIENGVLAVDVLVCRVGGGEKELVSDILVDEGLAMSIGTSKSSMARSNGSALSLPEFDLQLLERSFDDVQSEAGTEVAAANCSNPLPNEVKNTESLASFRRQLKTHLFKHAFLI